MFRGTAADAIERRTARGRAGYAESCLSLSRFAFFVTIVVLPSPVYWEIVPRSVGNLEPPFRSVLLYGSDIPLVIAVLAWAVAHLLAPARTVRLGPWYVAGPCLTLLTLTVLSPLWAHAAPIALESAVRTVVLFGFYLIAANERRASTLLAGALVVGLVVQSPIATAQFVTQAPIGLGAFGELSWYETTPGAWLRGYGLSMHPNVLGGFLALGLLALVWLGPREWRANPRLRRKGELGRLGAGRLANAAPLAFIPQTIRPRLAEGTSPSALARALLVAHLCILALGTAGLLSTFSRSGWLGLAGGLVYVGVLVWRRGAPPRRVRALLGSTLVIALVAIVFTACFHSYVATRLVFPVMSIVRQETVPGAQLELNVIAERNALHDAAASLIAASPLLGVGAGNFSIADYERRGTREPERLYQPEHNVPLLVTAELGPLGGLAWLLLMVAPLVVLLRPAPGGQSSWLILWGGALLVALIVSQFDFYFWGRQQGRALFWALLGVWVAARERDRLAP